MRTNLTPWPHQQAAYDFVASRDYPGAMLAMDMGTGKTKVAVDLIQNSAARRILILCPKSVIDVWPMEIGKHWAPASGHIDVIALTTQSVKRRQEDAEKFLAVNHFNERKVVVINYEAAWRMPFRAWALEQQWDLVIADESHRAKRPGGKISRFMEQISKRSGYNLALTGTPMPHSPLDLYAQARFINPTVFGTRVQAYKDAYAHMGGFNGRQIIGWHHLDDLYEKMARFAFRVDDSVLHLPEPRDVERTTSLEPKAHDIYAALDKEFIAELGEDVIAVGNALTKMLRLHELAGGWLKLEEAGYTRVSSAREELLSDVLTDLPKGKPFVIFCRFLNDLDVARVVCAKQGFVSAELSGRRNELKDWQNSHNGIEALLVQVQAGAEGIDLTRAHLGIFYSVGLSLGQYQQLRKRIHRPGQQYAPTFMHLIVKGTVDRKIYSAFAANRKPIDYILEKLREEHLSWP